YLPAPEMEEKEERNIIQRAVVNTSNKSHKYMLNMLFKQEVNQNYDYVFDISDTVQASKRPINNIFTKGRIFGFVLRGLENVMQKHCAFSLPVSTFMPSFSSKIYE